MKDQGLIFNIQRFSIHDGPGIRTTVFMMGCPLKCRWCSNPESWEIRTQIMTRDVKCIRCSKCVEACPVGAITMNEKRGRKVHWAQCTQCLECASVCPAQSIVVCGKWWSLEDVVAEVESDRLFYQNSGGGVTVSGGEPLYQPEFVRQLLKACKEKGLHTAMDTCGCVTWDVMESCLEYVDLVLYDIKHMDSRQHRKGTGRGNQLILANAERAASKVKMWLRIPVIAGYNDSVENFNKLGEFGQRIGASKVSLLPYHEWGKGKYEQIGKRYTLKQVSTPTEEHFQELQAILQNYGLSTTVGA